jgi:predicted MPP superfamily phosphohydrolase
LSAAPSWLEGKWVVRAAAVVLSGYAVVFGYALLVETRWVERTETRIAVAEPVLGRERFRIVQLSDLHFTRLGARELRVIDLVQEAKPDLIVVTGDLIDSSEGARAIDEFLKPMEATYGKYGVTGNNDWERVVREQARKGGLELLCDEVKLLEEGGRRLRLVGQRVVPTVPLGELLAPRESGCTTIYLHHKPDAVDELGRIGKGQRVDLFLCGHTHGGQVCLPLWGPVFTNSKYHKRFERGLYQVDGVPMYVNRGIGVSKPLPIRFLARPEVAVIDLVYVAGERRNE